MRRPRGFQQRGERRIAAALRIALAAALLAVQVLFVVLTTRYLRITLRSSTARWRASP